MSITVFGKAEPRALEQLERCVAAEEGAVGVLCADNHVGYSQPIGGAVGYEDHVSVSGAGYDIGCGNLAVRTPLQAADVEVPRVMDEIARRISFGVGRVNDEPVDHPILESIAGAPFAPQRKLLDTARKQLGTVGGGNHYVDLFADEDHGRLWIGVHFGSRGFGHKTATGFLSLAAGRKFDEPGREGGMDDPPVLLDARTELGQSYVEAMALAQNYAYAGRDVVVRRVLDILGTTADHAVHNHHNFIARERHGGRDLWVVRKGCTPAFPGQEGFVGGSMGGLSVILAGRDSERSAQGLYSTVHGAGRVMSRRQAAGKVRYSRRKQCSVCGAPVEGRACRLHPRAPVRRVRVAEQASRGEVDWPSVQRALRERGIELRGGAADEAPQVYKDLEEVLDAHGDTIEIRHRLRPIGVAMAGADVVDPYKD